MTNQGKTKANPNLSSSEGFLPSREELFVGNYFDSMGIKYTEQFKTPKLEGDSKKFRKIDFKLTNLKVFVEYCGLYNASSANKEEYDKKFWIFVKNDMPSVFLYPHELGFLDYAFHTKILKVMRHAKFKKQFKYKIFKYKLRRYLAIGKGYYFLISLFFGFLYGFFLANSLGVKEEASTFLSYVFLVIFSFYFVQFFINIHKFFFQDN